MIGSDPLSPLGQAAVSHARNGFHVFPCLPGSKRPAVSGWQKLASADPVQVEAFWRAHPDANIGWVPDLSGNVILDVDTKHGAPGLASLEAYEIANGPLPETLTIGTPSGGEHRIFRGRAPTSANHTTGLDFRGGRGDGKGLGYGLLPPSATPEGPYTIKHKKRPHEAPAALIDLAKSRAGATPTVGLDVEPDLPVNVAGFREFMNRQAGASEGGRNDTATQYVGYALDYGLSKETALPILYAWCDRCTPPMSHEEIDACGIWTNRQNSGAPLALDGSTVERFERLLEAQGLIRKPAGPVAFRDVLARTVAPVAELIPGLLERQTVTFLSGPGGVHKSRLALQWGLCLDAGQPIFGRAVEPATFVYLSCEDHRDEVARRAQAITKRLGLQAGSGQFWDLTGDDATLAVVKESGECTPLAFHDELRSWLQSIPGHKFVVADSTYNLLRFEGAAKINEGGVKAAIGLLQRLCDEADCSIVALWHPSQAGQDRGDASGWSVAWHNAPRARLSLTAVKEDGDAFTLKVEKRNHGRKGDPITLHWSDGVLLPLTDVDEGVSREALLQSVVRVAIMAAEAGAPIQMGSRRLFGWQLDEIERDIGRRPVEREVKEALASALPRGQLRYIRTSRHRCAGYYPADEARAHELAILAKRAGLEDAHD